MMSAGPPESRPQEFATTGRTSRPLTRAWLLRFRDSSALIGAVLLPLAVSAAMIPFRDQVPNTDTALVLVLVIVAVAANGYRAAGYLTAGFAGFWFDFFLTRPYERLTITGRADVETTLLLLFVGVAVTELAARGRRLHLEVARQAGYTAGIEDAAALLADTGSPTVMIDKACEQVRHLLGLQRCRFDYGVGVLGGAHPRLGPDGNVEVAGVVQDVDEAGLPTGADIELLVLHDGQYRGRFLLRAGPGSRPSLAQRLVATAIADRVGAVLATHHRAGSS